jgi:DNA-binding CsgD family transcriptional regulator
MILSHDAPNWVPPSSDTKILVGSWQLTGRDVEIAMFNGFVRDGGKGIILTGPPGVGKTRLASEYLRILAAEGFASFSASGHSDIADRSLEQLVDLLPAELGVRKLVEEITGADSRSPVTGPANRRIALMVDEIGRLGESSAAVLHDLVSLEGVFLIGTMSDGSHPVDGGWPFWANESLGRLEVEPLDDRAVAQLLSSVLGGPVELRTRRLLAWLAGGDLSALREIVIAAVGSGALSPGRGVWQLLDEVQPSLPMASVIATRINALSSEELRFLEAVAHADPLRLEDVARFGRPEVAEALERSGLLVFGRVPWRGEGLVLPSPISAELVRSRTPRLGRQRLASELAELEEARPAAAIDFTKLARWRMESVGGTAELMLRGARAAHQDGDLIGARTLVGRALEISPSFDAALLDARLAVLAGCREEGLAAYRALLDSELDGEVDDGRLVALALAQLEVPTLAADADAWSLVDAAVARIRDPASRAAVVERRQRIAPSSAQSRLRSLNRTDEEPVDDDPWMLMLASHRLVRTGRAVMARARAQQGRAAHQSAPETPDWRPWVFDFLQVECLIQLGDLRGAHRVAKNLLLDHLHDSDLEPIAWFSWQLCRLCGDCGFPESAVDHGFTALSLFGRLARPELEQVASASLVLALTAHGRLEEAEQLMGELGEPLAPGLAWTGDIALARAWVAATRGDLEAAAELLWDAVAHAQRHGDLCGESVLLHTLARIGQPRAVVDRLGALARTVEGDLVSARAEHALGLAEEDPELLERASARLEELGALMVAAEATTAAARLWRRRLERDRATAASARGVTLAGRCGDPALVSLDVAEPADTLTRAERVVAELATTGLSNREIATRLSVSQRTVENQLHQVYRKLGITNRHQLTTVFRLTRPAPDRVTRPA